jgi:hypothetical protein
MAVSRRRAMATVAFLEPLRFFGKRAEERDRVKHV